MSNSLIVRTVHACTCIYKLFAFEDCGEKNYNDAILGTESFDEWVEIGSKLQHLKIQVQQKQNALAFTFVEVSISSKKRHFLQNGTC